MLIHLWKKVFYKLNLDYIAIGNKIKKARQSKNISRSQFALMLNVSSSYIGRIERGTVKINLKRIIEIANLLDVSMNNLIDGRYME